MLFFLVFLTFFNRINEKMNLDTTNKGFYYLSDISYDSSQSYPGWGNIMMDKNPEGKTIRLNVDGEVIPFFKGIGIHARGQLLFDISQYSNTYTKVSGYVGIDASKPAGDVTFRIQVSHNDVHYDELAVFENVNSAKAFPFSVTVKGMKYLRFIIHDNGNNEGDHSVLADVKLHKEGYVPQNEPYNKIKTLKEYDDLIKSRTVEENYNNIKDLQLREFCAAIGGKSAVESLINYDSKIKPLIDWLIDDKTALELLLETGEPQNYINVLMRMAPLYEAVKNDINNSPDGEVYKKMMIALTVANTNDYQATPVGAFSMRDYDFDLIERFGLYKYLYNNKFLNKEEFRTYNMELLRLVMNSAAPNDELLWVQGYAEEKYPNDINQRYNYYNYIPYRDDRQFDPNLPIFWDEANRDKYTQKYGLDRYNIEYGVPNALKYWMQYEVGGICYTQSRLGQDLRKLHGQPTQGTFQEGHEALLFYSEDKNKNGIWNFAYNLKGTSNSFADWTGLNLMVSRYRMLLGWTDRKIAVQSYNYNKKHSTNYMFVAQAAMNDKEKFKKSSYINKIAKVYEGNNEKIIEIANEAIRIQPLNLDAFDNIIFAYEKMNKNSAEWRDLMFRIIETFRYYPVVFSDCIDYVINLNVLDEMDAMRVHTKKDETLREGCSIADDVIPQALPCRELSGKLLGETKVDLMSFSFDGPDANMIVINKRYDNSDMLIKYSFDNCVTWKETFEHRIVLTKDEISKITSKDGIKVMVVGLPEVHVINISEGEPIEDDKAELNDFENRLFGCSEGYEFSYDNSRFYSYTYEARFPGDQTVYFRRGAYNTTLAGPSKEFHFNKDETDHMYVPITEVEFVGIGGETDPGERPENMLDGMTRTSFHTKYNVVAHDKSFIVKFKSPRVLTKVTYDSREFYDTGRIKTMQVWTKENEKDEYVLVGETKVPWPCNEQTKTLVMDKQLKALYVKLLPTYTYKAPWENQENMYVSGTRFNFFEAPYPIPPPTIYYPTEEPTVEPTKDIPTVEPTKDIPTVEPTKDIPTVEPTKDIPTVEPTKDIPTVEPTKDIPTVEPTKDIPTVEPTNNESTEQSNNESNSQNSEVSNKRNIFFIIIAAAVVLVVIIIVVIVVIVKKKHSNENNSNDELDMILI